jgi:hypothetical protein
MRLISHLHYCSVLEIAKGSPEKASFFYAQKKPDLHSQAFIVSNL